MLAPVPADISSHSDLVLIFFFDHIRFCISHTHATNLQRSRSHSKFNLRYKWALIFAQNPNLFNLSLIILFFFFHTVNFLQKSDVFFPQVNQIYTEQRHTIHENHLTNNNDLGSVKGYEEIIWLWTYFSGPQSRLKIHNSRNWHSRCCYKKQVLSLRYKPPLAQW